MKMKIILRKNAFSLPEFPSHGDILKMLLVLLLFDVEKDVSCVTDSQETFSRSLLSVCGESFPPPPSSSFSVCSSSSTVGVVDGDAATVGVYVVVVVAVVMAAAGNSTVVAVVEAAVFVFPVERPEGTVTMPEGGKEKFRN